jgi:hypothetical protein
MFIANAGQADNPNKTRRGFPEGVPFGRE